MWKLKNQQTAQIAWKMKIKPGQEQKRLQNHWVLSTKSTEEIDIGKGIRNRQRLLNSLA